MNDIADTKFIYKRINNNVDPFLLTLDKWVVREAHYHFSIILKTKEIGEMIYG